MVRMIAERQDLLPKLGELFRERGFSGTSLSEITHRTGLGKGSLYHFFPDGKKEMAEAVLEDVSTWFEEHVFLPLRKNKNAKASIRNMFKEVNTFFNSGERICLMGAFALDETRDKFSMEVQSYFENWVQSLSVALKHKGYSAKKAKEIAEEIVASIQGALVLARSQNNTNVFAGIVKRLQKQLLET